MIIATKCAPNGNILSDVCRAGLKAVELHLSKKLLNDVLSITQLCKNFPLRYAVHAPNDGSSICELVELTKNINAEIVVFHNNYWEEEWPGIIEQFKNVSARLCIENTFSVQEPVKFMRRYGIGRCLDLEHLQINCAGINEEAFISLIEEASHIHLSGYRYGSTLYHTHIHESPEQAIYMLGLLRKTKYSGFVVSEAQVSLQTYSEFKKLVELYNDWENKGTAR